MKLPIRPTIKSRRDIRDLYAKSRSDASQTTAERFLIAVDRVFSSLAAVPRMGARLDLKETDAEDLRYIPLSTRFKQYLVIYRPLPDRIEIIRVVHGARDLATLLESERGDDDD